MRERRERIRIMLKKLDGFDLIAIRILDNLIKIKCCPIARRMIYCL
jgi:hypothetical protein